MGPSFHDQRTQGSNGLDGNLHPVARVEPTRRVETHSNARGSPGGDDIAGFERYSLSDEFDQLRDLEEHVAPRGIFPQLSVYLSLDPELVGARDRVGAPADRSDGAPAPERIPAAPPAIFALEIAGNYV